MSDTSTTPTTPTGNDRRMGVVGPWIAALWLLFLISPFVEGWSLWSDHRDPHGIEGMIVTVCFALLYVRVFVSARAALRGMTPPVPLGAAFAYVGALLILGLLLTAAVGSSGTATAPFIAVIAVFLMPLRYAGPFVLLVVGATLAVGWIPGWPDQVGNAFGVVAGALAVFGFKTVLRRNADLLTAHEENAQLLVDNERNRFARDLHDILGHSLTVITVKAELANRLYDVDHERARAEIRDLERLARDALADVRRAVEGYRDLTLPGEIARARTALAAAEIRAELPNSTDDVPTDLRELFAWTIREGVTNVIRHSAASSCTVRLTPTSAEVVDDGRGAGVSEPSTGHGLLGLRERADAVGATVSAGPSARGFALRVAVS